MERIAPEEFCLHLQMSLEKGCYVLRDISLLRYQRLHLHKPSKEQLDVARQNETLLFLEPLFCICISGVPQPLFSSQVLMTLPSSHPQFPCLQQFPG